jgi:hypothetical protein
MAMAILEGSAREIAGGDQKQYRGNELGSQV